MLERARQRHGADVLDRSRTTFGFRGDRYAVALDGGRFTYTRIWTDTTGAAVRDVLDNDGFTRTADGQPVALTAAERDAALGTLNSVVYFALLPYALADPAVQPRQLGRDTLRGEPYDLVEVTFRQEDGGRDWQDRFLYWLHAERGTLDYLAYRYFTDGGGTRFREAVRPRTVGGVRFADYRNYAADSLERLEDYAALFEAGRLRLVSTVALDSVRVEHLP